MNPYESPATIDDAPTFSARRTWLTWHLVPALFCWIIGSYGLLAINFTTLQAVRHWDRDDKRVWLSLAIPMTLISGVINVIAGNRWYRRRVWPAFWFTLFGFAAMALSRYVMELGQGR
ncbi:MAG: hypothetical protein QM811_23365 [Pirellulales bacterium]